jgi:hypothetical protein
VPEVPGTLRRFTAADWTDEPVRTAAAYHRAHGRWLQARRAWEAEHGIEIMDIWERMVAATHARDLEDLIDLYADATFIQDDRPDPRWST